MNLQELLSIMETGDMSKCKTVLETHCLVKNIADCLKQYEPKLHDIADPSIRRDIPIYDDEGAIVDVAKLARLPLSLQKKIVLTSAAFLGIPQPQATPDGDVEENMMEALKKTWEDNK